MFNKIFTLIIVLYSNFSILAQQGEVLFTVEKHNIYKNEFIRNFNRNYDPKCLYIKDSVIKFLDYFIKFKQTVLEAKYQGLDKSPDYLNEIDAYKKLMLQYYLADKETVDFFAKQAFERSNTEIRIKQILIRIDPYAAAKDTLLAYQRALNIRKKLINGEDFEKLAISISDDPSAIFNGGDFWYVKPFILPLAVENYIYSNPKEKISYPIRSSSGYHIVEILDKRPNPGRFKVAHIMLAFPQNHDEKNIEFLKNRIDSIYNLIMKGQNFSNLAVKFSDDKGTSANGGELPWFESGKMPREFETECIKLTKDGEISKPVKTSYGWHIIKRISHLSNPPFDQIREQLINKVIQSERGEIAVNVHVEKLKKLNNYKFYNSLGGIFDIVDSTIFNEEWQIPPDIDLTAMLFSYGNQNFKQADFANYLQSSQKKMFPIPLISFVNLRFEEFVNQFIIEFTEKNIEKSNPEFENSIDEYKEGFLYSKMMEDEIWKRIEADSIGLKEYYKKNKSIYNKSLVADVCIYSYHSNKSAKVEKKFKKFKFDNISDSVLEFKMRKLVDPGFSFSGCYQKTAGEDEIADECINLYKSGLIKDNQKIVHLEFKKKLIWLNQEIKTTNKSLEEVKNMVLSDYRDYIEKSFEAEIKNKFKVVINQEALESIINH